MQRQHPFAQVDVFSPAAYLGNPVAVILEAEDLEDVDIQRIARWTNLSETTFVLPPTHPEADYRLRIFTPGGELPFAGHPTLGSAHAWLEHGGTPTGPERIVQECEAGLVQVRRDAGLLSFAAPPTRRSGDIEDEYLDQIVDAFGIERDHVLAHQWVDNGPGWAVVRLATAERGAGPRARSVPDPRRPWWARSAPIPTEASTPSSCARSHRASASPKIRSAAA